MEIWKNIDGCEGYEVSSLGRVKSFLRKTPRLLKPRTFFSCDYLCVRLTVHGVRKFFTIHRLVAQAFISNPDNKPEVNHINGDKYDNRVENLEWVTSSENNRHAFDTGLNFKGEKHPNAKLTNEQVEFCRSMYKPFDKEFGAKALARRFGVSKTTIQFLIHNKHYRKANCNEETSRLPNLQSED